MTETIELVTFRLATGDAKSFVAANTMINDWLKEQPGFISRQLGQKEDGSWIDVRAVGQQRCGEDGGAKAMAELATARRWR